MWSLEHQNVAPFARDDQLHQRVGAHRKARKQMHQVRLALHAAQRVRIGRDVEE
jgi:hypothetical protein